MMKRIFGMMALALALAACNKEQDVRTPAKSAEGIAITATLVPKSVVTKAVVEDEDQIIVTWAENEHLAILYEVNAEKKAADATVMGVDKDGVATISFEVAKGTPDGTDCTIVYPFSAAKYNRQNESRRKTKPNAIKLHPEKTKTKRDGNFAHAHQTRPSNSNQTELEGLSNTRQAD